MKTEEFGTMEWMSGLLPENFKAAIDAFQRVQAVIISLSERGEDSDLTPIKAGTVLLFAIIGKITSGKNPEEFSEEDWKDIAETIAEYAILADGRSYTIFVFETYADYLASFVEVLKGRISPKVSASLLELVREIHDLSRKLEDDIISEPDYVENCLWICFEGVLKVIAAATGAVAGKEFSELSAAVGALAIQYGRLMLYRNEQVFLDDILLHQIQLDEELNQEYELYLQEAQSDAEQFKALIADAFSPDFRDRLQDSVRLARAAGVREEEILQSEEDIDAFFLN